MAEYIERDNAIDELTAKNLVDRMDSVFDGIPNRFHRAAQRVIAGIPAADVRPVVKGEWLLKTEPDGTPYCLHCSVCDGDFRNISITTAYNFCPHCGARMLEDEDGDQ